MSLNSYDDLKTAVANWVDRDDLTSRVSDFITLGESRINKHLRIRQMERRSQMSTIADTEYYWLPPGWLKGRHLKLVNAYGSADADMEYLTPESLDVVNMRKYGGGAGIPKYYTIVGNEFRFLPKPTAVYTIEVLYYKKLDSLSSTQTSNEVFSDFPDIYLYAGILEASIFLKDAASAKEYGMLLSNAITAAQDSDQQDRHSGGALNVVGEQIGV